MVFVRLELVVEQAQTLFLSTHKSVAGESEIDAGESEIAAGESGIVEFGSYSLTSMHT